jgi:acetoin utilization protein AcuC
VLALSIHEAERWPKTGPAHDTAGGSAINLPVEPGFNDTEMAFLRDEVVLPVVDAFQPQVLFLQTGADALMEDPLSKLALSNNAIWDVVGALNGLVPRTLVVGGGGYNPWSVARCWSGIWGVLNGFTLPDDVNAPGEAFLRSLSWHRSAGRSPPDHWYTTLRDPARPGPIRPATHELATAARLRIAEAAW